MKIKQRLNMLIQAAADSVQELRKSDIYRAIESAHMIGLLDEMTTLIKNERSDLENEINECLKDIWGVNQ